MTAVVPSHGRGLVRPWQPGQSGNPSGHPRALAEALSLARTAAPDMIRRLVALATESPDDRTQALAAVKVLEFSGLANLAGLPDSGGQALDLTHLTPEERAELAAALAVMRRLTGRGPEVAAEVAEADAVRERIAARIANLAGGR